jgi:apolipoprotein N-acyltransferase
LDVGEWADLVEPWMIALWVLTAIVVVGYLLLIRRIKGTYWGEPPESPWLWLLGLVIVLGFIWLANRSEEMGIFVWGLAAFFCGPALLLGLLYRADLAKKGLRPKYVEAKKKSA